MIRNRLVFATLLLCAAAARCQVSTEQAACSGTIPAHRPVMTSADGTQMILQTGTNAAYGNSVTACVDGMILVATHGVAPGEFDVTPTSATPGLTAYPLNGYWHWDPKVVSDNNVNIANGVGGKIRSLNPGACANCADFSFAFSGRKGTQVLAASIADLPSGIAAALANPAAVTYSATAGAAGSSPLVAVSAANGVTNLGFTIPAGPKGDTGTPGTNGTNGTNGTSGTAATVTLGTISTGAPGSQAQVVNTGTPAAAVLNFTLPQGVAGQNGTPGINGTAGAPGAAATVTVGTVTAAACGTAPAVSNSGMSAAAVLNFSLPDCRAVTGSTGNIGGSLLALGTVASGTATLSNATIPVGRPCYASPADGVKVVGTTIDCAVSATGVATVTVTGLIAVTPPAKQYNVRVAPN